MNSSHVRLGLVFLMLTCIVNATQLNLSTVAQLRTTNGEVGDTALVSDYSTAGDGGGGEFSWDESSNTGDNGGTVFGAPNGRWLRKLDSQGLSVLMFGAKGDGIRNDREDIQKALDEAYSRSLPLRFAGRRYLLRGAVLIPGGDHSTASHTLLTLGSNAGPQQHVQLFGEGATLYTDEEINSPSILFTIANFSQLLINDITFSRKITGGTLDSPGDYALHPLDPPNGFNRMGVIFYPVVSGTSTTVKVELISLSNVRFIDCHRAFHVRTIPNNDYENFKGRIKTFRVANCDFLYPFGCNASYSPDGQLGSQATHTTGWIENTEFVNNTFDGGVDLSKAVVKHPKDGFIFHQDGDLVATGNKLKHFGVEGIYAFTIAHGPGIAGYIPPGGTEGALFPLTLPGANITLTYTGTIPSWIFSDLGAVPQRPVEVYLDGVTDHEGYPAFGLGEITAINPATTQLTLRKRQSRWDPKLDVSQTPNEWVPDTTKTRIVGGPDKLHIRKYFEGATAVVSNNEIDGEPPFGVTRSTVPVFYLNYNTTKIGPIASDVTAAQLQSTLNSVPAITADGGVGVQALGELFIVTFNQTGNKPELFAGPWSITHAERNLENTRVRFTAVGHPFALHDEVVLTGMQGYGIFGRHKVVERENDFFSIARVSNPPPADVAGAVGTLSSAKTVIEGNASTHEVQKIRIGLDGGFGNPGIRVADMKATVANNVVRNCASGIYISRYHFDFGRSDNAVVANNLVEMPSAADPRLIDTLLNDPSPTKVVHGIIVLTDYASVYSNVIRTPLGRFVQGVSIGGDHSSYVGNTLQADRLNGSNVIDGINVSESLNWNFESEFGTGIHFENGSKDNFLSDNRTTNFAVGVSGAPVERNPTLMESHTSIGDEVDFAPMTGLIWSKQSISFLPTAPGWYRILTAGTNSFSGTLKIIHDSFQFPDTHSSAIIDVDFSPYNFGRRNLTQRNFTYHGAFGRTAVIDAVHLGGLAQGELFIHASRAALDPIKLTWETGAAGVRMIAPSPGVPCTINITTNGSGQRIGTIATTPPLNASVNQSLFIYSNNRRVLACGGYTVKSVTSQAVEFFVNPALPNTASPDEPPLTGFVYVLPYTYVNSDNFPKNAEFGSLDRFLALEQSDVPSGGEAIQSGTANPNVAPQFVGQNFLNTLTNEWFVATGLFETDWKKVTLSRSISFLPTGPGWYRILKSSAFSFSGSLEISHNSFQDPVSLSYADIGVNFSTHNYGRRSLVQNAFTYHGNFGRSAVVDAVYLGGFLDAELFIHVARAANDPIELTWKTNAPGAFLQTPEAGIQSEMVISTEGGVRTGTITTTEPHNLSVGQSLYLYSDRRKTLACGGYVVKSLNPLKVHVNPGLPVSNPPTEPTLTGFIFPVPYNSSEDYPRNAEAGSLDRLLVMQQSDLPSGTQPLQTGTATPNVEAQFVGQNFLNTSTGEWFVATGLFETDWKKISLNGRFGAGTVSLPAINFGDNNDSNTGIFQPGVGSVGIAIDGSLVARFDSYGIDMISGTVVHPGYGFKDDADEDTGIYRIAENTIGIATDGAQRVSIGNSGVVIDGGLQVNGHTKSLQRCFSVNKNGTNQTIPLNTWTKVTWSSEKKDVGGCFSSDKWTPDISGVAELSAQVLITSSAAGEVLALGIQKNGSFIAVVHGLGVSGGFQTLVIPTIYDDANGATDYYDLWLYRGSGTSIFGGIEYTQFNGKLH